MAQCVKCGKKGFLLKVNNEGLCKECDILVATAAGGVPLLAAQDGGSFRYLVAEGAVVKKSQPVCGIKYSYKTIGGLERWEERECYPNSSGKIHFLVPAGASVTYKEPVAIVTALQPVILGTLEGFWGIPWSTGQNAAEGILKTKDNLSSSSISFWEWENALHISNGDFAGFKFETINLYFYEDKFYRVKVEYKEAAASFESLYDKIKEKYGNGLDLSSWNSQDKTYQWDFENGRIELQNVYRAYTYIPELRYNEKNIEKLKQEGEQDKAAREQAEIEARGKNDL
ncbi:hypothetical protein LQZ19_04900 [Treponema primitia]|uniref:hypothetical protein n=1 Tax=Treponema primitia TaxID=88058 RepID=UPI00397F9AA4